MRDEEVGIEKEKRRKGEEEKTDEVNLSLIPHPSSLPIFYDEQKTRWPRLRRFALACLLMGVVGAVTLIVSIIAPALLPRNPLPRATAVRELGNQDPILSHFEMRPKLIQTNPPLTRLQRRQLGLKFARDRQKLEAYTRRERSKAAEKARRAQAFLMQWPREVKGKGKREKGKGGEASSLIPHPSSLPVVAAFYVNWEETSWASAQRNMGHLTHFIPEWLHLKQGGADVTSRDAKNLPFLDTREDKDKTDVVNLAHSNGVPIVVLLNNYTRPKNEEEGEGKWDTTAVHALVGNPTARHSFAIQTRDWLLANKLQGINIDFEEVTEADRDNLTLFMRELYYAMHPAGLLVTQDAQLESGAFDFPNLAKWNDWLVPMFYDEHESSSGPGAVAGVDWTRTHLNTLLAQVSPQKIVMAVGQQGYDWTKAWREPSRCATRRR